jgi:hypothetical protein
MLVGCWGKGEAEGGGGWPQEGVLNQPMPPDSSDKVMII